MNRLLIAAPLLALAACGGGGSETATFVCPNGPNLAVLYTDDSATLSFNDGRTETLPKEGDGLYARPGLVWQIEAFRTARLTDGQRSLNCDETTVRRL